MPVALAADAMLDRRLQADAQGQQVADLRTRPAPLFPIAHPDAPSQPLVQFRDRPVVLADAKVSQPASHVLPQLVHPVRHRHSPASAGEFLHAVLECRQLLFLPADFAPIDGEAQKAALAHSRNLAFGRVEFQSSFQVARQTLHDSFPRPLSLFLLEECFFGSFSALVLAIAFPITAFQSSGGCGSWPQSWVSLGLCGALSLIFMHSFKLLPNKIDNQAVKQLRFLPPGYIPHYGT